MPLIGTPKQHAEADDARFAAVVKRLEWRIRLCQCHASYDYLCACTDARVLMR
jgi:hypothetical protein